MAAKKFPLDEIDSAPAHGGRHRARRTSRDRVREFIRVLVVAVVVAGGSLFGLRAIDAAIQFDVGPIPSAAPVTNVLTTPGITVLDGTNTDGAASGVAHKLLDAGFNVLTADNLESTVSKTVIMITDENQRTTAKKVLAKLGDYSIEVSSDYTDPITVILGKDSK